MKSLKQNILFIFAFFLISCGEAEQKNRALETQTEVPPQNVYNPPVEEEVDVTPPVVDAPEEENNCDTKCLGKEFAKVLKPEVKDQVDKIVDEYLSGPWKPVIKFFARRISYGLVNYVSYRLAKAVFKKNMQDKVFEWIETEGMSLELISELPQELLGLRINDLAEESVLRAEEIF